MKKFSLVLILSLFVVGFTLAQRTITGSIKVAKMGGIDELNIPVWWDK